MIVRYEVIETVSELDIKWAGKKNTREMLLLKYGKTKGKYFLMWNEVDFYGSEWTVYKVNA